jgi:hypothetical protein
VSKGVIGGDEILSCMSYINLCISVRSRFYLSVNLRRYRFVIIIVEKFIHTICHKFEIFVKIPFGELKYS